MASKWRASAVIRSDWRAAIGSTICSEMSLLRMLSIDCSRSGQGAVRPRATVPADCRPAELTALRRAPSATGTTPRWLTDVSSAFSCR